MRERRASRWARSSKPACELCHRVIAASRAAAVFLCDGALNRSIDRWFGEPARQIVNDAKAIEDSYFKEKRAELLGDAQAIAPGLSADSSTETAIPLEQQLRQQLSKYKLTLARVIERGRRVTVTDGNREVQPDFEYALRIAEQQAASNGQPVDASGDEAMTSHIVVG